LSHPLEILAKSMSIILKEKKWKNSISKKMM
jgi:hypothetical protein